MSYSTDEHDYFTNDTATARDSEAFLRAFFARYPHLAANDFYISGARHAVCVCVCVAVRACRADLRPHGCLCACGCR
jgi:hypothetical protein